MKVFYYLVKKIVDIRVHLNLEKPNKSNLKKDLIWNYISIAFLGISGIGINSLISIFYDPSVLGSFNQVLVTYLLASIFGSGGINFSVLKTIAQHHSNELEIPSIIKGAIISTLFSSILMTIFYLKSINIVSELFDSNKVREGMISIAPGIFFFSFNKIFLLGILNGFERMRSYAIYQALRYLLIFISLIICIKFSLRGENLTIIFVYSEIILFTVLLFDISYNYKWFGSKDWIKWSKIHIPFGLKSILSSIFIEINTRVDVIMLGLFFPDSKVGIYSFSALFAEGFFQLIIVLQNSVNPKIAQLILDKEKIKLEIFIRKIKITSYRLISIFGILAIISYPFLLSIITNKSEYKESFMPFATLIIGIVTASGYLPFQNILILSNKPFFQSLMIISIALINVFLNFLLIPILGINGASIATALSTISSMLILKNIINGQLNVKI